MAITASTTNAVENTKFATISHIDDAGSPANASYNVGFTPRYIKVDNVTDRTVWEWYEGMTSAYAAQTVAAGTRTLITSGGPTVSGYTIGFPVLQSKQYRVQVIG